MSDEKTITEREAVLREREASAKARCAALYVARVEHRAFGLSLSHAGYQADNPCEDCEAIAARRYPLPRVARPRVMSSMAVDYAREFRVRDDRIEQRYVRNSISPKEREWHPLEGDWTLTPAVIRLFADLLANPTEVVDDDAELVADGIGQGAQSDGQCIPGSPK